jgi:hypothetical protein
MNNFIFLNTLCLLTKLFIIYLDLRIYDALIFDTGQMYHISRSFTSF